MKNAYPYIGETLRSVLSTRSQIEVVVVDDGSTDGSVAAVKSISDDRIRIVQGPCAGIARCLNTGLMATSGRIIMRCDADDLFPPGKIDWQVKWLDVNHDFGAVCGSFSTIDRKGVHLLDMDCGLAGQEITSNLRKGIVRTHLGTFAIRSGIAKQLRFRPFFKTAEDTDFQFRLGESTRVMYFPILSYKYRIHSGSMIHSRRASELKFYDDLAKSLQLERSSGARDSVDAGERLHFEFPIASSGIFSASLHEQGLRMARAWQLHHNGLKRKAIVEGVRAAFLAPYKLDSWKSLLALIAK
jgi:glycosyltransferase involved in cell wall biosynthesis